jgi:hypothetical protein
MTHTGTEAQSFWKSYKDTKRQSKESRRDSITIE